MFLSGLSTHEPQLRSDLLYGEIFFSFPNYGALGNIPEVHITTFVSEFECVVCLRFCTISPCCMKFCIFVAGHSFTGRALRLPERRRAIGLSPIT